MEKMREKELALDLLADVAAVLYRPSHSTALSTISISRREVPAVWRSC